MTQALSPGTIRIQNSQVRVLFLRKGSGWDVARAGTRGEPDPSRRVGVRSCASDSLSCGGVQYIWTSVFGVF